jgi:Methyltransferase domain
MMVPARLEQPELLDLGRGSPADVAANLTEMWRANRYLGGLRALTLHLYPRLVKCTSTVTVLDLGTGSAEIPVAIWHWAQSRGLSVHIVGVDWAARNLAVARARTSGVPAISLLQADAACLPVPPASVDFVISSLFLHHVAREDLVRLLGNAFAIARRGIIMSDLARGWMPLLAFKLTRPIIARNFLTGHDGALSIRRAYTPTELLELADAAKLPKPRVYEHLPWRMTLVADK